MKLLPKIKWVLFQDDRVRGQFFQCGCGCKTIHLDALNLDTIRQSFLTRTHETIHALFALLPFNLSERLDFCLDITWGNQADALITHSECLGDEIIYEW